jgi:hypothetical protein
VVLVPFRVRDRAKASEGIMTSFFPRRYFLSVAVSLFIKSELFLHTILINGCTPHRKKVEINSFISVWDLYLCRKPVLCILNRL